MNTLFDDADCLKKNGFNFSQTWSSALLSLLSIYSIRFYVKLTKHVKLVKF